MTYHAPGSAARGEQHGAALLALMLALFLVASAFWLKRVGSPDARAQRDRTTALALAQAREALIGRAAADDNRPGSLPCPDTDNDGGAQLFSGDKCPGYIGRLPWKTLDIPETLDGDGERLWYALAPSSRDSDQIQINPSKTLELSFDGVANVAAVVFSPGAPLAAQTGRPSNTVGDYLEGANSDGDSAYASGARSSSFNDRALAITRDDLFAVVNRRVLAEIRGPDDNPSGAPKLGLRHYHAVKGEFPWADNGSDGFSDASTSDGRLPYQEIELNALPPPPQTGPLPPFSWLSANGWLALVKYQRLSADAARLTIGNTLMDAMPCAKSPCQ